MKRLDELSTQSRVLDRGHGPERFAVGPPPHRLRSLNLYAHWVLRASFSIFSLLFLT